MEIVSLAGRAGRVQSVPHAPIAQADQSNGLLSRRPQVRALLGALPNDLGLPGYSRCRIRFGGVFRRRVHCVASGDRH